MRGVDRADRRRRRERGKQRRGRRRRVRRHHDFASSGAAARDRARERCAVGGEDEAGRENVDDGFEFAEILRQQRIGHRDRRIGNADMHGGKAEKRMFDVVAGENGDRAIGG